MKTDRNSTNHTLEPEVRHTLGTWFQSLLHPEVEVLVTPKGSRITVTSTRYGRTSLDVEDLFKSKEVQAFLALRKGGAK